MNTPDLHTLPGVIIATAGKALTTPDGQRAKITFETLDSIIEEIENSTFGELLPLRTGPKLENICGGLTNFRYDGNTLRADFEAFDTSTDGKRLLEADRQKLQIGLDAVFSVEDGVLICGSVKAATVDPDQLPARTATKARTTKPAPPETFAGVMSAKQAKGMTRAQAFNELCAKRPELLKAEAKRRNCTVHALF
jgi:hypothetical protein